MSHMGNDLLYLQYTVFPIAFFIIKVKYFFTYKFQNISKKRLAYLHLMGKQKKSTAWKV